MSTAQRVSRGFHRLALFLAAIVLAGCSDNTEHELAACKLKAMDKWPEKISSSEHDEERAYYVKICMETAGYKRKLIPGCDDAGVAWVYAPGYYRDTWWGRMMAGPTGYEPLRGNP